MSSNIPSGCDAFTTPGRSTSLGTPRSGFVVIDAVSTSMAGTAINAAISALPADGGTIVVPAGDWVINTAVLISKNGVILRGVSHQSTVLRFDGSTVTAAVKMSDTTQRNVVIEDMRIECSSSGKGTAIDASYFVNSTIRNLRIGGSGTSPRVGIDFKAVGSHYNVVENCRISVSGANSACVRYVNFSNSNVLRNCRLFGDNANTVGVHVDSHAVCIDHIDIEADFLIGIDVASNGHDCLVIAPYIEAGKTGIRLDSNVEAFTCLGGVIIDNVVANITDKGAQSPLFLNTRLQYDPYTSMTAVRSSAFPRSYPVPGNMALPQDHGLEAWTVDPAYASGSTLLTNGTQYFAAIYVRNTVTITKLHYLVATGATTPTAGQNWIGIYNSRGTRLQQSGIDAKIASAGPQEATIASLQLTPGVYWIGLLCNAATAVTLARASGVSDAGNSMNLAAANLRYFVNGTGKTTLDPSVAPASNAVSGSVAFCAGVEQ
ncbi:hypothetical protein ACFRU3_33290 [Streptomyces sp. NPDC056910]|uniref:hypothetical protein n=1 Tax=Streptomyces sp. NPDC056910 TaxID=3345964 RepID=UPI0036B74CE5